MKWKTSEFRTLTEAVENFERQSIIKILRDSKSIRDGAQRMGITHTKLLHRINKYGITSEEWENR
ncbi:MAG: hypothetical protein GXZ11_08065 [Tissierellia bacterium]|nr:hypothetical protein [Tissierellia bacterium]